MPRRVRKQRDRDHARPRPLAIAIRNFCHRPLARIVRGLTRAAGMMRRVVLTRARSPYGPALRAGVSFG